MSAAAIAQSLGDASREGRSWRCRCPLHGGRSLVLRDGQNALLLTCFAGCESRDVLAELRRQGLVDGPTRTHEKRGQGPDGDDEARRIAGALQIWGAAGDVGNTLAAAYLARRKLVLPEGASGRVLRFHSWCPYGNEHRPALIGLFTGIHDNVARGILRIALAADGNKLGRKMLGRKTGCAIKLTPDEDVTMGLAVGEGVETTLAGMMLGFVPAWTLGDADGIKAFPVLAGIEALTIFVDADENETGQRSARTCSARWTAAGREVLRIVPVRPGEDLADVAVRRAQR